MTPVDRKASPGDTGPTTNPTPNEVPYPERDRDHHRWLDATQQEAWRSLVALLFRMPGALDTHCLGSVGLTHFASAILCTLSTAPEQSMRQIDITTALDASPSRVSHTMVVLEGRGLTVRRPHRNRGSVVTLTSRGAALLEQAAPAYSRVARSLVLDGLSEAQTTEVAELFGALATRPQLRPTNPGERRRTVATHGPLL
ncbi:MarR family winged helix-turn-helix transcriptional regulator [Rhodococcus sp. NPDC057297]|uniref:MarR family winged helix-turn-helix transcriptional regulator n=1 Tax=Rhodococcus sp. NPDC057297 TaxID=3346090 RepID=UPI00363EA02F